MTAHGALCSAPLVLVSQHFGSIVYSRHSHRIFPFDRDATDLLLALKSKPLESVLNERTCRRDADAPREERAPLRSAIVDFYTRWQTHGFFSADRQFQGYVIAEDSPPRHCLRGPLTVHLEVTRGCNLRCAHCFAAQRSAPAQSDCSMAGDSAVPGPARRAERVRVLSVGSEAAKWHELTVAELEGLFAELAQIGTFRLGITGGEPLLRRDIIDIIDCAADHGLSPCLTTNGTLITDDLARALARRSLAWLNVSLEGASAETNDVVRGDGSFESTMQGIRRLSGICDYSIAFTLMKPNAHEAGDCVSLARQLGARAAVFRPCYPVGRASECPELLPSFEQYSSALASLAAACEQAGSEFCSAHAWGPHTRYDTQARVFPNFGCGAANTVCSVSASGDVSPCSFLGPAFLAGSIRQHSIAAIWRSSAVFQQMRRLEPPDKCGACARYDECGGGCRARALAHDGSVGGADPWCAHDLFTQHQPALAGTPDQEVCGV